MIHPRALLNFPTNEKGHTMPLKRFFLCLVLVATATATFGQLDAFT